MTDRDLSPPSFHSYSPPPSPASRHTRSPSPAATSAASSAATSPRPKSPPLPAFDNAPTVTLPSPRAPSSTDSTSDVIVLCSPEEGTVASADALIPPVLSPLPPAPSPTNPASAGRPSPAPASPHRPSPAP
eukprot:EG_transcript_40591